jgi:hypothetical protein
MTSLVAALGLAGGGYLAGREEVAAAGALVGAVGLIVERLQTRSVRVRLRSERARHRSDLQEVDRTLHEVQHDVAALRADLDEVRAQRDVVRVQLQQALDELALARQGEPPAGNVSEPVAEVAEVAEVVEVAEALPEATAGNVSEAVTAAPSALPLPLPLSLMLPGQVRSPIATGGIPMLAPGPCEPLQPAAQSLFQPVVRPAIRTVVQGGGHGVRGVEQNAGQSVERMIDPRSVCPRVDDDTQPIPVMTAALADAFVHAALADADAAALPRSLEAPGAAGGSTDLPHTGDARHAGGWTGEQVSAGGDVSALLVVRRGKHVA